jgi:chloramphenicol 3-O phosphotransferase
MRDGNRIGVATDVIVLNGGSSSGKSSIARCLQELLDQPWVKLALDDLLAALAPSLVGEAPPREGRAPLVWYGADGTGFVDAEWESVESAWYAGVVSMARAGLGVIIDEVLLHGEASQRRLAALLDGLEALWVGVHCDPAVAAAREASRADRVAGMAASQATTVHAGVRYDVTVDTTTASIEACAQAVLPFVQQR